MPGLVDSVEIPNQVGMIPDSIPPSTSLNPHFDGYAQH